MSETTEEFLNRKLAEAQAVGYQCVDCRKKLAITKDLSMQAYCVNDDCVRYGLVTIIVKLPEFK